MEATIKRSKPTVTATEFILSLLLALALVGLGLQYRVGKAELEAKYRKGVMFGHRCVNASVANAAGKVWAAESFRLQAAEFADYHWVCKPGESLLLQER